MKKKGATKAEKDHMSAVQSLGCIPCKLDAIDNVGDHILIHHAKRYAGDSRCHFRVIGMCYGHHQSDKVARHNQGIAEFQKKYGDDTVLLKIVDELLSIKLSEVF